MLAKTKINTELLLAMNPCRDRLANWLSCSSDFKGDIIDFLSLDKITPTDKIWVCLQICPIEVNEVFAIDCAFAAADYAASGISDFAAYAADYAAAYAADDCAFAAADYAASGISDFAARAADYAASDSAYTAPTPVVAAAAYAAERERQVDCFIYLITTWERA